MIDPILSTTDLHGASLPKAAVLGMGNAEDAMRGLVDSRWDVVFFCAKELPPPPQVFKDGTRRVRVFHVPLDDGQLSKDEAIRASQAANIAARYFLSGKRVLVTCLAGKNRSGLVAALAVDAITGEGGKTAAGLVRAKRTSLGELAPALSNPAFLLFLSQIEPRNIAAKLSKSSLVSGARG